MQDAERAHRAEVFPNLQTPTFLNHHEKNHEKSGRRAGCRLPREGTKLHSLSTKPVMNWKGWVELKSRFPAFAAVPFQRGLPQSYNVLEFTFTCLLTHSSAHWEVFIRLTSTFAIWCRKLCNFRRQEAGGRGGGRWGRGVSEGHIGILSWFLGGHSHKILWKGEKLLCIRLLCSGSWLVLIFIRNVGGICGSLVADARPVIWHFSGPKISLYELSKDRNCD